MTYNTINTKNGHHTHGFHCVGTGPEVIVILGSCRVLPYFNYLDRLNTNNRFSVVLVNVVNFSFDAQGNPVNGREFTKQFETNEVLMSVLKRCKWFLHEHICTYGMFNVDKEQEKHIYQFGMAPEIDISIPNWNDIFILFQELVDLDTHVRQWTKVDMETWGAISGDLKKHVKEKGESRIQHFLDICAKTSLPEFGRIFQSTWRGNRYWWTGNHISSKFTTAVFQLMNNKFLHLALPDDFISWCLADDAYSTPCSRITKYDREAFGIEWPQATEELTIP